MKRSTAAGPRIPNPTNPTRTNSILGAFKPITLVCPVGRSGVSMTIVPLSQCHFVPRFETCVSEEDCEHEMANIATSITSKKLYFLILFSRLILKVFFHHLYVDLMLSVCPYFLARIAFFGEQENII